MEQVDTAIVIAAKTEIVEILKVGIASLATVIAVSIPILAAYVVKQQRKHNAMEVEFTRVAGEFNTTAERMAGSLDRNNELIDRMERTLSKVQEEILKGVKHR